MPELPPVLPGTTEPLQKEETKSWTEKVVCNVVSMAAGTGVSKLCILNLKQLNAPLNNASPWSRQEPGGENLLGGPRLASSGGPERGSWLG